MSILFTINNLDSFGIFGSDIRRKDSKGKQQQWSSLNLF
ncbi:hypothetical protein YPPY66_1702 [Yersinia pestis PY-66]|uniref:Uncharacterized protein n=1 Tax=Yersinia pestis biovar Orientalis str. IP275 TaxID=373665 RepID=A0AAV3BI78_YERPE|nr:hypothetical protein YPC_2919 [Yersinia pestis biovar Medievalis str. Harbin 35]EDR34351.1 hypothetical protein YPIP275_4773 [Yersinia pestis biovar Orientalis str. IP275]EIQ91157.1 hypothetical protein YPPY01_1461 [Yersinia pestis PY-01]EIQ92250.1 hypothetical protein YPPY02_1484 [Yersinia pestis PY-02]EIQ93854.1 hypothetical protein YPPY03_1563 [Yersinia pestis PY-03]EIR05436.1 hypothetical protein YPPY04_1522 [Yersinia pestis PY-04]EIR06195.1 hypothetical protein YPPY05_1497 [Yersinia p